MVGTDLSNEQSGTATRVLFTIAEAEVALNWGRTSIYQAIGKGLIRAVWLGRSVRIPTAEIDRISREGLPE